MHDVVVVPNPAEVGKQKMCLYRRAQVALLYGFGLSMAYLVINPFSSSLTPYDVMTAADRAIPFVPEWVWIYTLNIPMPLALILYLDSPEEMEEHVGALLAIFLVAAILFVAVPVQATDLRPAIDPQASASLWGVATYYEIDGVGNCLPSLHVAYSLYAGAWGFWLMPRLPGVLYGGLGVAIAISTMLVKQHFVADVVTATALVMLVLMAQRRGRSFGNLLPKTMRRWIGNSP